MSSSGLSTDRTAVTNGSNVAVLSLIGSCWPCADGHQLTVATGSCLVSRLAAGTRRSLSALPTAKPWHQTRDSDSLCKPTQGCQGRIRMAPSSPGSTRRSPALRRLLGVASGVHEPLQSRAIQFEQYSVGPRAETSAQRTRAEPRRRSPERTPRGTDPPA